MWSLPSSLQLGLAALLLTTAHCRRLGVGGGRATTAGSLDTQLHNDAVDAATPPLHHAHRSTRAPFGVEKRTWP